MIILDVIMTTGRKTQENEDAEFGNGGDIG